MELNKVSFHRHFFFKNKNFVYVFDGFCRGGVLSLRLFDVFIDGPSTNLNKFTDVENALITCYMKMIYMYNYIVSLSSAGLQNWQSICNN